MIYCKDCGEIFEEEQAVRTKNFVDYGFTQIHESTMIECPCCGSTSLERDADIVECDCCGTKLLESDATYDFENEIYLCARCQENTSND